MDGVRAAVVAAALVAVAVFASVLVAVVQAPKAAHPVSAAGTAGSRPEAIESPLSVSESVAEPENVSIAPVKEEPLPIEAVPEPPTVSATRPALKKETPVLKDPPSARAAPSSEAAGRKAPEKLDAIPKRKTNTLVSVSARPSSPHQRDPRPSPKLKGVAVMVIDDAGHNLRDLEPFLRFPAPLTIAVLPGLAHSAEAARRVRAAGKEVILHQPMEAVGGQNPGPGAIRLGMSEETIRAILRKNVEEIGPVVGINNHEGSKVTADERTMKIVLDFCRERGLFFLDSKTTAASVVPALAARTGMSIRERDVFVDNIQERAAMIRYLQEGLQKAEKKGSAVMIGHVWSSELASTLQELYPELVEQGFSLSTIARIMMGTYDDEGFGD